MTYQADFKQGLAVRDYLLSKGVESPFTSKLVDSSRVEDLFRELHKEVGLNLEDDSIQETPRRLAKLYSTKEFFAGMDYANFPKATVVENKMNFDEMVLERNIKVSSLCEHHWLPIVGSAYVGYIPNKTVLGLSKLNRIVDFFCRRPQIQERLTAQIFHALSFLLQTDNVCVMIKAEHMCVQLRGIEDPCSDTVTSKLGGLFKSTPSVRAEFFSLAGM